MATEILAIFVRSMSFPRKNVTPADVSRGESGLRESLPPKRAGFRLALRLAGMTEVGA